MAIDGLFLHTLVRHLKEIEGSRITKIHNLGQFEFVLTLHKAPFKELVISLDSNTNRIYLSNARFQYQEPTNFTMLLRKTINQGIITGVEQIHFDRIVEFTIESQNEIGLKRKFRLIVELMGKYANASLVEEGIILDCVKRIPALENSKRILLPQFEYEYPKQPQKKNPFCLTRVDPDVSFPKEIYGFSPLLGREFQYRMKQGQNFGDILKELDESRQIFMYASQYHLLPLMHLQEKEIALPLMQGLENLFQESEHQNRTRQKFKRVFRTIQNEKKKLERKLPKLEKSRTENENYDQYREYGDLIFAYLDELVKQPVLRLESFETGNLVEIPVDMRFNLIDNANLYYKKYQKAKRSLAILDEQIEETRKSLEYFRQLETQTQKADYGDLEEIEEELVKKRYLYPRSQKGKKKGKKPNLLEITLENAKIWVGKNNLQNEYLLRHVAQKSDLWFHVKDYHGSHVILRTNDPDEFLIRLCAQLAAHFSQGANSSSLPVNYTRVAQLKRVPAAQPGFVTMKNYQTIFIDPAEEAVEPYIRKKG